MLVLGRKLGQRVMLDVGAARIEVMVTRIVGNQVWLGFAAPQEVAIHREELLPLLPPESRFREVAPG